MTLPMNDLADAYQEHVAALLRAYSAALPALGWDAVALHAGAPMLKNRFDDQHLPLSPTPAFAHWLPAAVADAWIVIAPGRRPRLVQPLVDDFWEAPPAPPPAFALGAFDVETVAADRTRAAALAGAPARTAIITRDPDGDDAVNPAAVCAALDATRTRKSRYERACLALATARAVRGHRAAAVQFANGENSELRLHLAYLEATDQDDAETPYKNIVAIGRHAATLHHVAYERGATGPADQSLLVDAGAAHLGYHADITRTHVRGSTGLFAELVLALDRLQQELCARIRPGMAYEALHDLSHELLAAALCELGIGRGSAEALVARGVTRALFPHGLGHSLGLQTHDVGMKLTPPRPENRFLRNTSTIEVDQVFTIEPGCYFIEALIAPLRTDDRAALLDWKAIDALWPYGGIRIEDNVLVDADGVTNLTRLAFAT
ncbi:MAG: Xaa-Pro dipeptidase [Deltaproteobacteria bacterium]|nr:Xaa-Pro dipeptidase [Deltaproteobacteria bacterium]